MHRGRFCNRHTRSILIVVAILLGLFQGAVWAQPVPDVAASLRRDLAAGKAAAVLERVRNLISAGTDLSVEAALVGAEAALELQEWGHAGSLGSLATRIAGEDEDGRPKEHRGFEMEAHALFNSAQAQVSSGRPGALTGATFLDAGVFYQRARAVGGDPFRLGYFESEAFRGGNDPVRALRAIDAALTARPEHWDANVLKARILIDIPKAPDACALLRELRKRDQGNAEVAHLLLLAVLKAGDRATAQKTFLELVGDFPEDLALYGPFNEHFRGDKPATFLRQSMEAASKVHPASNDRFPCWYLGHMAAAEGQFEDALLHMRTYRDQKPSTPEGHYWVGRILTDLDRLDEARVALLLSNARGMDPTLMVPGLQRLVSKMVDRNDYDPAAALQGLVLSLSMEPEDELNLGALYYNGGRTREAIGLLERLAVREADSMSPVVIAKVWDYIGLYRLGVGLPVGAEKALRRSIQEDDSSADATENLGLLLIDTKRREEGVRLLDQVLVAEPERHRSRYHRLRAQYPEMFDGRTR